MVKKEGNPGARQKKELLTSRVSNNFTNIFLGIIYSIVQVIVFFLIFTDIVKMTNFWTSLAVQ